MKYKDGLQKGLLIFIFFTVLCGVFYTGTITLLAQTLFPQQANGSVIEVDGKEYGSALLGQQYEKDTHMWGRVMVLDTTTYTNEKGEAIVYGVPANQATSSKAYEEALSKRVAKIKKAHPTKQQNVPVDLVSVSGSGLDPHISLAAAKYQVERLMTSTNKSEKEIMHIIDEHTSYPLFGVFGEATVNVLKVNLTLDGILKG